MNSIYNNIMALNTANTLNWHYSRLGTSVQRLSTGLRVNSAADDAAGLAIRELMRADIAASTQGIRNANDAISLLQVADGALGIIDEKLIRMKELAEQAATGTYDATQRLMINSEFQAMASEIDRIARATDFNGIKLLDGSREGEHDGKGLDATGKLKIHFGTANDSAEDYYYIEINDCTTKGLGLRDKGPEVPAEIAGELRYEDVIAYPPYSELNDLTNTQTNWKHGTAPFDVTDLKEGVWYCGVLDQDVLQGSENTMLLIKAGTTNFVLNEIGTTLGQKADNDIQLFTRDGKHLAGRSPLPNYDDLKYKGLEQNTSLAANCELIGFTIDQYDASFINSGVRVQDNGETMNFTHYNGMTIGYSGDGPPDYDNVARYEVLAIDKVTEDLVVWMPGVAGALFKYYTSPPSGGDNPTPPTLANADGPMMNISTQEKAQQALPRITDAIVAKDKVRAHLGALQNRLENTVSNLSIQTENLQAAESRISDTDVATEMTQFVRNQVLTQSAVAMLGQANSYPHMLTQLLNG